MPPACWRAISLVVLLGLFSLDGVLWLHPAEAASQDQRRDESPASKQSRRSKVSLLTLPPAMIQNLRTAFSPESFRLVLDLDRKTRVKKHLPSREGSRGDASPHAALSQSVQAKIAQGSLDGRFIVRQTPDDSVTVTLPNGSFQRYALFSLTNPPRLVVDVIPSGALLSAPTLDMIEPAATPAPPPQPRRLRRNHCRHGPRPSRQSSSTPDTAGGTRAPMGTAAPRRRR